MHVFRGRAGTIEADRDVSRHLLSVADDGEPAVRVWVPHRQVAFGRRDARLDGYDRAREAAREHGFPPVERSVGGRAVAYDGETTIAFARAEPIDDFREGTDERYDRLTGALECVLEEFGLEIDRGEPDDAFCPGTHSLSAIDAQGRRRKLVGIAQRVRRGAALVAGILLVAGREELASALADVYGALGVPLTPATVGSVQAAGGPGDPARIRTAIEDALVGDDHGSITVENVGEDADDDR
ncbi:biotin/lipoate A/B protein ligase family protein [Halosolutus amylolyticus]|uniref:Biotin/lipoate A/B protein ligase family protein n=1 Tax=Halosolutus amylolyticus TaxID=2932267 RepID=A0ABD5PMA8_9EURY|nr:lipoate--protein ligase family protein [Halosolutus amylolyticus]